MSGKLKKKNQSWHFFVALLSLRYRWTCTELFLFTMGPQCEWNCESQFYIFFEPEKKFSAQSIILYSHISHLIFSLENMFNIVRPLSDFETPITHAESPWRHLTPTHEVKVCMRMTSESMTSQHTVTSPFMGLHDPPLYSCHWMYLYIVSNQTQLLIHVQICINPLVTRSFLLCSGFLFS